MEIAVVVLILGLFILLPVCRFKILEPVSIHCILWCVFIAGSVLFLARDYKFTFSGVLWLLAICYIYLIIARVFYVKTPTCIKAEQPNIHWEILVILILLALCSTIYTMIVAGVNLSVFRNFSELQAVAHNASVNRYASGGESVTALNQLLNVFVYAAPLCAGYSLVYAENRMQKIICYSSIVPVILNVLLTAAKLALVAFVIFFFVGFYTAYVYKNKCVPIVKIKTVVLGIIGVVILFSLFYLSFVLRIGKSNDNLFNVIFEKLMVYTFGHIQGFDCWFSSEAFDVENYSFGTKTFLAISSKLGLAEKIQGVYGLMPGTCTNVYTQYRGIIEDFGVVGSMLVLLFVFGFTSWLYARLVKTEKSNVIVQVLFAANIFWLIYFIVSTWTYTSYILTFIVFAVYLYLNYNLKIILRENNINVKDNR